MVRKTILTALLFVFAIPALASAHIGKTNLVDVRIISDGGSECPMYRTYPNLPRDGSFFYLEAVKGSRYSIQVTNRSGGRIGVVIAVDGRNIISGRKSDLKQNEQMYIVGPHETNTFEGWRTGMDRTNRFYFTNASDSYAERVFADASAMGTIALAVFREKLPEKSLKMQEAPAGAAAPRASGESQSADKSERTSSEQAGTGFGETTYSPARRIHFEAEPTACGKGCAEIRMAGGTLQKGNHSVRPEEQILARRHGICPHPEGLQGLIRERKGGRFCFWKNRTAPLFHPGNNGKWVNEVESLFPFYFPFIPSGVVR